MRHFTAGLATALIATTMTLGSCQPSKTAETSTPTMQASQADSKSPNPAEVKEVASSDEWVIEDREVWIPVLDELGEHLQAARRSFLKQDTKTAATQINDAAAFLERESNKASTEGKASLGDAIAALKKLASEVKSGTIKSVDELDPIFIRAYQADTEHLWVVVDEQYWFPTVEKSARHWQAARENFLKKDYLKAAREIHKGTAFLKLEVPRASGEIKSALLASVRRLDQLAQEVKQGKVTQIKVLENTFAEAHFTAVRFYDAKAQQATSERKFVKTGYDLKAAAHHLEMGAAWIGREKATGLQAALKDTRLVAEQLIEGRQPESTRIDKAIAVLGQQGKTLSRDAQSANNP